ncbi:MAG: FliM/FliN family flagellar motor switch protein [Sphingobium sp.]|jgi:flagellar motor switch protein FliM|uniref:flagellar motor switch protein FliM n=1 Tax=Sphingobium sp. TaxID=1912891 RepID=UPI000C540874|nr:FliM/FliN family flagellar motor switch protein [Sphingobium sp.]MBU0658665.1 FliM/FliN family flagellar motor switch protein [Alphaproteobacteria bacterium]MBA4753412.1 FliM/FliN family flagellar motor switch protein [Sphingobium sp.]MBS88799.1 flagellar motor switch protein FliM [Sphingobium sp.]MBU0775659.1 FliM/FliN family flagellar motor switch protein [Alphaproteobacteria bacterium]MBU0867425.1 FliM/FliN family flagellar motor switch protein [Alphaproteobacteria bacterium]
MDDVQTYAFGRGESQAPMMLSGLDRLGEKLGRRIRALVEPICGVRPQVEAQDAQLLDFSAWSAQVPAFTSISIYRVAPLKGQVLLRMDAAMISTLVDCFYGGIGNRPLPPRGEFTPTEDRLIARLSESLLSRLVETWSDILPLEPALIVRETGVGFAASAQPGDQMVVQRFMIGITRDQLWPVDLVFPLAALRAVEPLMGTRLPADDDQKDPVWQSRIARRMRDIRLPARTVLARPNLSLAELMQLKVGDVIPVTISRSLPLIVGNRIVARGSIGEQDGRAAFQIEKIVQGPDQ